MSMPCQKSRVRLRRTPGPQCPRASFARKIPLEVTTQLLIFRYHGTTEAIYVLHMRFGCQQVDHIVGALWVCRNVSSIGTGANIR